MVMDVRAAQALAYMDAHPAEIAANHGAMYVETEILRILVNKTATSGTTVKSRASVKALQLGVPTVLDRADAYILSHHVFFATDFGRRNVTGIDMAGWSALLSTLVVTYALDTDVLGELLISAKCIQAAGTGFVWTAALTAALTAFGVQWAALDRSNAAFAENYHQIIVGGILFSLL